MDIAKPLSFSCFIAVGVEVWKKSAEANRKLGWASCVGRRTKPLKNAMVQDRWCRTGGWEEVFSVNKMKNLPNLTCNETVFLSSIELDSFGLGTFWRLAQKGKWHLSFGLSATLET